MQALMEAATVAGSSHHHSHTDLAKCIWLLTLDDAGDSATGGSTAGGGSAATTTSPPSSSGAAAAAAASQAQRLARTFEERASRVHPDAFLPWLHSLTTALLRPEGRFVANALRSIAMAYPTALASLLRPLQHQLAVEVERDHRIAAALTDLSPDQRRHLDEAYAYCVDPASRRKASAAVAAAVAASSSTGSADQQQSVQHASSLGTSSSSTTAAAKRAKKRVVVVMRGAEGEKLGEANSSQSSTEGGVVKEGQLGELQDMEIDEDEAGGESTGAPVEDDVDDTSLVAPRTGYLSPSVGEGLHRVNLLYSQLRQRHPMRLFVLDRFVEGTGGRLLPSWSENLLSHLRTALSQLHEVAWAQVSRFIRRPATCPSTAALRSLTSRQLPPWMARELVDIVQCCGLPPVSTTSPMEESPGDESDGRTGALPSYSDNAQLAHRTLLCEAEADSWFKPLKERLISAIENVESKTVLDVISLLTHELIPLVEQRVNALPRTSYLTDRGAAYLIETISAASNQCTYGTHLRSSTTTPVSYSVPLELPGDTIRLKTIPSLFTQPQQPHTHHFPAESQQPNILYLAEILPCVIRVPGGGRRLALRANNGRIFHYDLSCLPRELPAGRAVSIASTDITEASSLAPTLRAYAGWREAWCPPHLFQALNEIAARCPETAKRRLGLVAPR